MAAREDRVRIELGDDGVAQARLARAAKHNGLDWAMFEALNAAIDELTGSDEVRAVVLSGEGPSFCAGLDFKSFMGGEGDPARGFERRDGEPANFAQRAAYGWRTLPMPVIAAVHGACLGGGLQLALAADLRLAAPDTRMSIMEIRYGLVPDMGLSQVLPGLVRDDVARELTYTGRIVEAEEAATLGLVTRIERDPHAAATELAREIAAKGPQAVRAAKRLLGEAHGAPAPEALALEEELQRHLLGSPEQIAAVAASLGAN